MQHQPGSFFHQILVSKLLGGAAGVAMEITRALRDQGDGTRIWLPGDGPAMKRACDLGFPVELYRLPPLKTGSRPLSLVANRWMARRLKKCGVGLAHVHYPLLYGLLRLAIRVSGQRSVVHVHSEDATEGLRWALRQPPDLIITCAKFLVPHVRGTLPDKYRDSQRIVALPNAVDTERFHPGDRRSTKVELGLDPDVPLILMLANLARHKGQETAIRAVGHLKRRGLQCRLWMAGAERGSEEYTGRLRQLIAEEGVVGMAELLGQREDAPDLLRGADLLLLPSHGEGLPLCVIEAQASKVPVLATPVGGIPEVVEEGETGYLIPRDDTRSYADRIQLLLQNPGLYRHIAEQAFERVRRDHGRREYVKTVLCLYEEVLAAPSGSKSR